MSTNINRVIEGTIDTDLSDRLDIHVGSYVKSSIQLHYASSRTLSIGEGLRKAIVELLDYVTDKLNVYEENDTTVLGNEHHLYHSTSYVPENNHEEAIKMDISSLAPTIFYQLREDIGVSNENFRQSFRKDRLEDFTNPGKSGSLMYKTCDHLFILKTLREYEARLLMEMLPGYHLQCRQRSTMFNRYIGLYSIRLHTSAPNFRIFIAIMVNAFTPSLQINEVFDLKGSTIKRQLSGKYSSDNLLKLKDVDFLSLYPDGIRIPTNIYQKLRRILRNDAKCLRKRNITDYSIILGVRHLDMSEDELIDRQKYSGLGALFHSLGSPSGIKPHNSSSSISSLTSESQYKSSSVPYLKPLHMIGEMADTDFFYTNDSIAHATLPIPGIINGTTRRVYLYLVLVDMLQTFDSFKALDQTYRKLTNYNQHLDYSVIEPDDYEKRFHQFFFQRIFVDACNEFPWNVARNKKKQSHEIESEASEETLVYRF